MSLKYDLITIIGPTASGKTQLATHIAKMVGGEIISGDSRQVYRGMNLILKYHITLLILQMRVASIMFTNFRRISLKFMRISRNEENNQYFAVGAGCISNR